MNRNERQVEALTELVNEYKEIEQTIATLPVGYISVKQISGHTYCYRQWREGSKIISEYVPEAKLSSVKRKIAIRKEAEAHLKEVKKELAKVEKAVVKAGLMTVEEVQALKA